MLSLGAEVGFGFRCVDDLSDCNSVCYIDCKAPILYPFRVLDTPFISLFFVHLNNFVVPQDSPKR